MNRMRSEAEESASLIDDGEMEILLQQLTAEEIDDFEANVDPDNTLLPPSQRCRDQTKKSPTGAFDREGLLKFLEDKAKKETDWEEKLPFKPGTKRGTIWKAVDEPTTNGQDSMENMEIELDVDDDFAETLKEAKEQDWVDLAGILGLHSLLSQTQYYNALKGKSQDSDQVTFSGVVRFTAPQVIPEEEPNETDIDECIEKLVKNDSTLTDINLNNIKIDKNKLDDVLSALVDSKHVKNLSLCSTDCRDKDLQKLLDVLEKNESLKTVNIESNYLTVPFITKIAGALVKNKSLTEFRADNQVQAALGYEAEMEISSCIEQNDNLLRFGLNFQFMDPRHRVAEALERNYEQLRLQRKGK